MDQQTFLRSLKETNLDLLERADQGDQDALDEINRLFQEQTPEPEPVAPEPVTPEPVAPEPLSLLESIRITDKQGRESYSSAAMLQNNVDPRETVMRFLENAPDKTLYESSMKADNVYTKGTGFLGMGRTEMKHRDFISEILKRPTADLERKAMLAAIEAQVEETESQEDIVSQEDTRMEDRQAGVRGTRAQAAMPDFEAVDAFMEETWGWLPETNEEFQDYEKHLKANDPVLKAQLDRLDRGGRANLLIKTREEDLQWQKKFQALAERGQSPSVDPGVYVWAHKRGLLDAEPVDIGGEISKLAKSIGRGSVGLLEGAIDAAAVSVAGLGMEFFGRHFVSREFYEDYMEGVSMSDEAASAESTGAVFSDYLDVLQGDLKLMGDGLKRLGYKTRKNKWEDSQLTDEERDQAFSEYLEDKRQFELSAMDNMVRYNRIVREVAADTGVAEQEVYDQLVAAGIVLDPTNLIPGKVLMAPVAATGKGVAKLKGAVSPTAGLRASLRNQMRLHADYLAKASAARTAAKKAAQFPQNKVYARTAKNLQKQADKTSKLYQKAVDSSQKAENAVRKAANKNRAALTAGDRARNVARGDQAVADATQKASDDLAGKIGSPGIRRTAFGEAASGAGKLGGWLGVAGQKAGEVVGSNPATFVGGLGGVTLGAAQTFGEGDDSWVEAGGKIIGGGVAGYYGTKATAKILSVGGEKFSAAGMNLRHFGGAIRRGQSHMPLHQVLMNHAYGQTHLSPGMRNLLERYDRVYMHPLSAVSAGALAGAGVGYAAGEVYDFFSEGDDSTPGALIGGSALLGGVTPRTALGLAKTPLKIAESVTSRAGVADIGFEAAQGYVEGGGDMDSALMGAAFGGVIQGAIAGGQSFIGPIGQVFGFEEGRNIDAILSTQVRLLEEIHQGRGRDIEGWFDNEVLTSTGQVRIGGQEMNFGEWFNTLNAAEKKLVARQTMIHPDVELRVFNDPNQDYPAFYSPEDETVFLNTAHLNWNTTQPGTQVSVALANTILGHEIAHYVGHHEGMDSEVIRNYFGNPALGHSPANSPFIRYEDGQPVIRDRDGNTVTMTEALAPDADGNARSDLHYELSDLGKARIYDYVSRMDFNFLRGFLVDENNQPVNASAANVLSQEFQNRLYAQDAEGNATDPDAQTEFIDVLSQQPQMLRYIARELFAEQTAAWMTGSEVFEMKSGLSLFEDNFRNLIGGLAGRVGDGFFKERGEVRSSIFSQLTQFSGVQKLLKDYNNDVARGRRRETEDGDVIDFTVTEDDYANNPQALELFDASGALEWEPVQAPSDPPATPPQAPAPEGPAPAPEGPTPPQAPAPEGPTPPTQVPPRQPKKDPKTGKPKIKTPKQQKKDAADLADAVLEWLANNPSTDPNTARPQEKGTVAGRYLPPELLDYLENTGQFNPQQIANLRYVNELLREGGEAIRTFYQAATGINSNGKRSYKALSGKWRTVIPHGIEITKGGNVIVRVIDPSQLHANAVELAGRPEFEALWGNNLGQMQADMMTWLNNMADATRSGADGGLGERKRNFFRVASGLGLLKPLEGDGNQLLTGDQLVQYERDADRQRAARDMEILAKPKGKRQAYIKSFRLDRMNQVRPAPGEGLENPHGHDAYRKALANLHTGVEYDEQNPAPYKIDDLGFYSPSERAAYERLPEEGKIHASRAWRILMNQKGVSEEAVWTGLKDFILWGGEGNKSKSIPRKSITRQEILDFIDAHKIPVEELSRSERKNLGEFKRRRKAFVEEKFPYFKITEDQNNGTWSFESLPGSGLFWGRSEDLGSREEAVEVLLDRLGEHFAQREMDYKPSFEEGQPAWKRHMKSPGGYMYREQVLRLPEKVSDYVGGHSRVVGEVANVISNVRMTEDGKAVLYIEETQSDANKLARSVGVIKTEAERKQIAEKTLQEVEQWENQRDDTLKAKYEADQLPVELFDQDEGERSSTLDSIIREEDSERFEPVQFQKTSEGPIYEGSEDLDSNIVERLKTAIRALEEADDPDMPPPPPPPPGAYDPHFKIVQNADGDFVQVQSTRDVDENGNRIYLPEETGTVIATSELEAEAYVDRRKGISLSTEVKRAKRLLKMYEDKINDTFERQSRRPKAPVVMVDRPYLLDQKWMPLILKRTLYRAAEKGLSGVSWSLAKDIFYRYDSVKGKEWPRKVYEEAINNTYRSILKDLGIKGEPDTVTLADGTVAKAKDKDVLGKTKIEDKSQNNELYAYVPITEELRHKVRTQGMPQFHTGVIDFDINNPANKDAQRSPANWSSRVVVAVHGKEASVDEVWPHNFPNEPTPGTRDELNALVNFCREEGRVLSADEWNERVNTLEHIGSGYESVVYREGDRVLKKVRIKPSGALNLSTASVGKFLRRQALFNEVFGGDVMFEGVVEAKITPEEATYVNPFGKKVRPFRPPPEYSLIISQKFHADLKQAKYSQIKNYLEAEGFEKAPDSMGYDFIKQTEDGKYLHARDAHEGNFMSTQPLSLERWKSREMEQYNTLFGKDWNADFFEQSADWDSAYQDYVQDFKSELVPLDIVTWMNESGNRYNPGVDEGLDLEVLEYHPGITVSQENIPGLGSRVLTFLQDADEETRSQFHKDIRAAFQDEDGNDIIAQELGLEGIYIAHAGKSVWVNSEGNIEYNDADQISGFKTQEDAELYTLARALYSYQEAGAGYAPSDKGEKSSVEFTYEGEAPMEQVLETVRESLEAQGLPRSATDDFAFFPTEEGVVLVHLGFNDAVTPEVVEVVVADVNYATGAIDNDNFKSDTFYHENNWRKDSSGGAFRKALETKIRKPRFRDLQKRLDGRLLQTLQGVYEKYGVPPEGADPKGYDPGFQQGLKPPKVAKDPEVKAPTKGNLFNYLRKRAKDGKTSYVAELQAAIKGASPEVAATLKKELRKEQKQLNQLKDAGVSEAKAAKEKIGEADKDTAKSILQEQEISDAASGKVWKNTDGTLSVGTPTKAGVETYIEDGEIKVGGGLSSWVFPNLTLNKTSRSLGKDIKTQDHATEVSDATQKVRDLVQDDPSKAVSGKGYLEILRKAGSQGDGLVVPSVLEVMLNDPEKISEWILNGGLHEDLTIETRQNAIDGLDGTRDFRNLIGDGQAPDPNVVAPLFLWGILSRMLPPIEQEAMWLRLMSHKPALEAMGASIEGGFDMTKDQWKNVVSNAVKATEAGGGARGKNATANANDFHAALSLLNGRWDELSNVFATNDAKEMRDRYWQIVGDVGGLGVKNKVLSFQGLTLGIPSWVGDRWQYVMANLPQILKMGKTDRARELFSYDQFGVPSDPSSVYAVYGTIDSGSPVFSNLLYEYMNTAIQNAIDANPKEFEAILGDHMNPGGFHWISWNAIKNEPVGHSSLSLLFELQEAVNNGEVNSTEDVANLILGGTTFTEGRIGGEAVKVHFKKGEISQSKE